jgi:uncharacterized protein
MLHLTELAKHGTQTKEVTIKNRLPEYVVPPCHLRVDFDVKLEDDFYLMHLQVTGDITLLCQRCMNEFTHHYNNKTVIAVCRNDERAEELQELYECIVSSNWHVDLEELVVDELHLYAPQVHPDEQDCGEEINQFLKGKSNNH